MDAQRRQWSTAFGPISLEAPSCPKPKKICTVANVNKWGRGIFNVTEQIYISLSHWLSESLSSTRLLSSCPGEENKYKTTKPSHAGKLQLPALMDLRTPHRALPEEHAFVKGTAESKTRRMAPIAATQRVRTREETLTRKVWCPPSDFSLCLHFYPVNHFYSLCLSYIMCPRLLEHPRQYSMSTTVQSYRGNTSVDGLPMGFIHPWVTELSLVPYC